MSIFSEVYIEYCKQVFFDKSGELIPAKDCYKLPEWTEQRIKVRKGQNGYVGKSVKAYRKPSRMETALQLADLRKAFSNK